MSLRTASLLGVLLFSACAGVRGTERERRIGDSDAIIFSHAKHVEHAKCETCHKGKESEESLGKRHGPTMKDCAECHAAEVKDSSKCRMCHLDATRARAGASWRSPNPHLNFSHKRHLVRDGDCVRCHSGAAVATSIEDISFPKMRSDCLNCHNHLESYRELRCNVCHKSLSRYPMATVSSFNHEGNYLREHGRWARSNSDVCGACHGQTYCADCHTERSVVLPGVKHAERVDRQFIHRGDWISRHPVESRAAPASCARCHSTKSCDACHQAQGASASSAGKGRSPHPPDWLVPGSPNSHGPEARRHITQCAGCHDRGAQSNCVPCHRSATKGGLGLRPHPPGWKREGKSSNPMCLVCH